MRLDYFSARGDLLPLVGNEYFELIHIDGLTKAGTELAATRRGNGDGDTVSAATAIARTIIIDLRIKNGVSVEEAKREVLRCVKIKQTGRLEWEQDGRPLIIEGIVEDIDLPRFTNTATMQISLHCSQPFWEAADEAVQQINEAIALHYFVDGLGDMLYFPEVGIPFGQYDTIRTKELYNSGDVAVGLEITIVAYATVTNPIIYDNRGRFLGVGYGEGSKMVQLKAGEVITITTGQGQKDIMFKGQSILHKLKPQSSWLQLEAGDNLFTINSDDERTDNMTINLAYKPRYV